MNNFKVKFIFGSTPEKAMQNFNKYNEISKKPRKFCHITHIPGRRKKEWMVVFTEDKV